ncbi:helix-turn-helix domain-containing protein [Priestia flexa]|jgi:DNA-binding transcriptional ArsR family regulator|uniref:ArsR family transcriptional regulator n=2 Tax=Priestia TaxID=2800373 RepID=A0A0V8JMQ2_9BACI|nr:MULTISPECIES: metalloregulator ArsR/SmtB family transcription factor [Bacillaceae]KSU88325.1 ArsR family transcriptional regulator [Priestia veravalensis]KZB90353.1 transcriptional regulator [Bacillus sp. VT 712]MBN8252874.1 winged helix-turn-helix transcriptional regulator [Priestia flexa]MBN8435295.1 winged helix-turn-helix transcriptional regulator [Priestia flexa]MCA0967791.1 helix-turn-helix domain-containing protein [Priestia flexa]
MENKLVDIFKVLGNETRLEMLKWLKDPMEHFDKPTAHLSKTISDKGGICVGDIQERANLSQSTTSHYLSMLQRIGLLESERHGKWTYYRRNEKKIAEIAEIIKKEL